MLKLVLSAVGTFVMALSIALAPVAVAAPSQYADLRSASVKLEMPDTGGVCSGTKITPQFVLTAAHCAQLWEELKVDGYNGFVVKRDVVNDLALVRVTVPGSFIAVSDAEPDLDTAITVVGFPLGIGEYVTSGLVQEYKDGNHMLISAPIAPGNSGGGVFAKVNGSWVLVGVAVAGYGYGFTLFSHLGVAVDIDTIKAFLEGIV